MYYNFLHFQTIYNNINLSNLNILTRTISLICKFCCAGYDMCELVLSSKGFLWHQVRCIMGVLLLIGQKLEKPDVISHLLDTTLYPQ